MNTDQLSGSLQQLEQQIPINQYNTWIRPLRLSASDGRVSIVAPNSVICNWAEQHYGEMIRRQLRSESEDSIISIDFIIEGYFGSAPPKTKVQALNNEPRPFDKQTAKPPILSHTIRPTPEYTFENFIEGHSNQLAIAAALQVLERPGDPRHNPLVICGSVGLGKTHLMHAIGNGMLRRQPNCNVVSRSTEVFVNEMINCIHLKAMDEFHHFYRQSQLLLLDDVQFFIGKEKSQTEIFHTIEALHQSGGQLVITCDKYPSNIREIESRLRSRFSQGLTVVIDPPDLETRAAILIRKAAQEQVDLARDCAVFIAEKITANVRELQGALNRVIASARFQQVPIDLPLVKSALQDLIARSNRVPGIDQIKKQVADYYGIRVAMLDVRQRTRNIVRPRQMAMKLVRDLTRCSLPEIGAAFGNRDHTTVIHACNIMEKLCGAQGDLEHDYLTLLRAITE